MPAGVAVMPDRLRETSLVRKRDRLVGAAAPGGTGGVDRADIVEQLFEEALLAPERRREAVRRIDVHHQGLAGVLDRSDVPALIEADQRHLLLGDSGVAERE